MFGTFEAEKSDIKIVYGLVDQPQFWNPLKHQANIAIIQMKTLMVLQVYYYGKVWEKAISMKTWPDFLAAFWKGPGWFPGTERLGDITFVSERPERKKYDEDVSPLLHIYTLTHFVLSFMISDHINSVAKVCFIFQNINIDTWDIEFSIAVFSLFQPSNDGVLLCVGFDQHWIAL